MDTNKERTVRFRISEQEGVMLDQLLGRFGTKASEYMRSLIREKHAKVFPAYTQTGKKAVLDVEPELTPEQACESVGGRVENVNGVPMCVIKISNSMVSKIPLSDTATILKRKKA